MKTIHITSQDDLPDVAEAVIEALGRRTVVAFRGEMGAGKTTLIREIAAQLGATAAASTISTSTASTTSAKLTTSATKSISIRATSVWSNGPKRSSSCCPTT